MRVDLWWAVAVEAEKQIYGCEQGNNMIPTGWICFLSLWLGLGKLKRIVKVRERLWIFFRQSSVFMWICVINGQHLEPTALMS